MLMNRFDVQVSKTVTQELDPRIRVFMATKTGWVLWAILTVSIALIMFSATEPAAFGFWWISVMSMFVGIGMYTQNVRSVRCFRHFLIVQAVGILIQVWLISFHWHDWLLPMDEQLHLIRESLANMVGIPFGQRGLVGIVWILITMIAYCCRETKPYDPASRLGRSR